MRLLLGRADGESLAAAERFPVIIISDGIPSLF